MATKKKAPVTKRVTSVVGITVVGTNSVEILSPDTAMRIAHDVHGWHVLTTEELKGRDLPSYTPRNARGWLVRGGRAAFLCCDDAGWIIWEYVAEPVEPVKS